MRRAVDDGAAPAPAHALHSGAGRLDSVRMRPFSLVEKPAPSMARHCSRLVNYNEAQLLDGPPQSSSLFAQLLESLAVLSARVVAEVHGAKVYHLRTSRGEREIAIIIEDSNGIFGAPLAGVG